MKNASPSGKTNKLRGKAKGKTGAGSKNPFSLPASPVEGDTMDRRQRPALLIIDMVKASRARPPPKGGKRNDEIRHAIRSPSGLREMLRFRDASQARFIKMKQREAREA
jgi:hypothetical protein